MMLAAVTTLLAAAVRTPFTATRAPLRACFGNHDTARVPRTCLRMQDGEATLLIDELSIKCCHARLEAHPQLDMPRLALRARARRESTSLT